MTDKKTTQGLLGRKKSVLPISKAHAGPHKLLGRKKEKKESKLVKEIREILEMAGWLVIKMHGNMYQAGFPDLFATHARFGVRLIEVKRKVRFTKAQKIVFNQLHKNGSHVYIVECPKTVLRIISLKDGNLRDYMPEEQDTRESRSKSCVPEP